MSGKLSESIFAAFVLAGCVMAGPLLAAPKTIAGSYVVEWEKGTATRQLACIDRWTLRADSTLAVESGRETLNGRWHVEDKGKTGKWLIWTNLTTNGLPNCLGDVSSQPVGDRRTPFYVNAEDGLVLTRPRSRLQDGSIVWSQVAIAHKVDESH